MSSESAGENEENPVTLTRNPGNVEQFAGMLVGSRTAKSWRNDGYGDWFCKCRTDDTATGNYYL